MVQTYFISFVEVTAALPGLVTKFGGQPTWLTGAAWPMSRATGEPLRFLCQIAVDPDLFGDLGGRMAYLFIADGATFVDNTWDPEGGENAVIIQPGANLLPTQPLQSGPSLYKMVEDNSTNRRTPIACEYDVILQPGEDRETPGEGERAAVADIENKISGAPPFLPPPKRPTCGPCLMLFPLGPPPRPFYLNLLSALR